MIINVNYKSSVSQGRFSLSMIKEDRPFLSNNTIIKASAGILLRDCSNTFRSFNIYFSPEEIYLIYNLMNYVGEQSSSKILKLPILKKFPISLHRLYLKDNAHRGKLCYNRQTMRQEKLNKEANVVFLQQLK